ncbi:MAG: hypothetical protein IPO08_23140 [Xanthomonadales bacterium]|nr:hypothetical protein [Xanthomonadales bacterium]
MSVFHEIPARIDELIQLVEASARYKEHVAIDPTCVSKSNKQNEAIRQRQIAVLRRFLGCERWE